MGMFIKAIFTSLFVSLFVKREPQQIFMGENTEYRANLVKARVNFPVTLFTYTGSVSISYFYYQKAGRVFKVFP